MKLYVQLQGSFQRCCRDEICITWRRTLHYLTESMSDPGVQFIKRPVITGHTNTATGESFVNKMYHTSGTSCCRFIDSTSMDEQLYHIPKVLYQSEIWILWRPLEIS